MNLNKRYTLKYFITLLAIFSFPQIKLYSKKILKKKKFSKVWVVSQSDN